MKLSPKEVHAQLQNPEPEVCFVDVRSQDEFASGHIPGMRCIPLDRLEGELGSLPKDRMILLSCQSGRRSGLAKEKLRSLGFERLAELDGGLAAWKKAGLPVRQTRSSGIPIQRQVLISAGTLVLLGIALSLWVKPLFLALSALVALGMVQAGFSGWCGMAMLLEKMPWNRPKAPI